MLWLYTDWLIKKVIIKIRSATFKLIYFIPLDIKTNLFLMFFIISKISACKNDKINIKINAFKNHLNELITYLNQVVNFTAKRVKKSTAIYFIANLTCKNQFDNIKSPTQNNVIIILSQNQYKQLQKQGIFDRLGLARLLRQTLQFQRVFYRFAKLFQAYNIIKQVHLEIHTKDKISVWSQTTNQTQQCLSNQQVLNLFQ